MKSPQAEDGFTRIANEILEALCRTRISGEVRQVVDTVFRKTYGYNKKVDAISLSQFVLATGLKKPEVCRSLNKAIKMNLIGRNANGIITKYWIIKDYSTWRPLARLPIVGKTANKSLANMPHTKDNIQKTIGETKFRIEPDTGKDPVERVSKKHPYYDVASRALAWTRKKGRKITTEPRQRKALYKALKVGVSEAELIARWEEMEKDLYWKERGGFDWENVSNSFSRKPV